MNTRSRAQGFQIIKLAGLAALTTCLSCAEQAGLEISTTSNLISNSLEIRENHIDFTVVSPVEASPRVLEEAVERIDGDNWVQTVRELAGDTETTVGNETVVIDSRHSASQGNTIAGNYLYERFSQLGLDVSFQSFDTNTGIERNVIATLPGNGSDDEIIVIGAHYDSTSSEINNSPGADDNASGTAALLEIARILVDYEFERTIQFIAFGAEEQGLIGSRVFVDELGANNGGVKGAIIMDMIGYYDDKFTILVEGKLSYFSWMQYAVEAASTYSDIDTKRSFYSFGSDHVSFQNARIPAYLLIEQEWNQASHYHTTRDTYDIIRPEIGYEVARAALAALGEAAGIQSRREGAAKTSSLDLTSGLPPQEPWFLSAESVIDGWTLEERASDGSFECRHDHIDHLH